MNKARGGGVQTHTSSTHALGSALFGDMAYKPSTPCVGEKKNKGKHKHSEVSTGAATREE